MNFFFENIHVNTIPHPVLAGKNQIQKFTYIKASYWILTRNCGAVMTWNMDTCVMVERSMTALKIGMQTKTTRSEILMVVSKSFKLNVPSHTKQLLIGCPALPQLLQEQTVLPVSIQISSTASPQATVSTN